MVLLAGLWLEHRNPLTLPEPSGHLAVGRVSEVWVNDARADELAPVPGARQTVVAWIWYPADKSLAARPADYVPAPWRAADARHSGLLLREFLSRDPARVHGHSLADASVSSARSTWPVVLMRAGGGAPTLDFTTLAEDLASHGYVVVGFDAPYRTTTVAMPDGRVMERTPENDPEEAPEAELNRMAARLLPAWVSDERFVVDRLARLNAADSAGRFTGRLDLARLGAFGHSFGGATSLEFCHDDARCKAAIDIDGAVWGSVAREGLKQPALFLLSDHGDLSAGEARTVYGEIRSMYDGLPGWRRLLTIRRANHFSFSDQILVKSQLAIHVLQLMQGGGLNPRRGLAIASGCVAGFFEVQLRGAPAEVFQRNCEAQPEVKKLAD